MKKIIFISWVLPLCCSLSLCAKGCDDEQTPQFHALTLREQVEQAEIVVKTLLTRNLANKLKEFWLLDIYKGAPSLAKAFEIEENPNLIEDLRNQRINVSIEENSPKRLQLQQMYLLYLTNENLGKHQMTSHSFSKFTGKIKISLEANSGDERPRTLIFRANLVKNFCPKIEQQTLEAIGWKEWNAWTECNQSCGGGTQTRKRICTQGDKEVTCSGTSYDLESRNCNQFRCEDAVNALAISKENYFKPSATAFQRSLNSRFGLSMQPGSYLLLPYFEALKNEFPADFTLFLSFDPADASEGTIFSLNDRDQGVERLALKVKAAKMQLVVHSSKKTRFLDIPGHLSPNLTQLGLSVHKGSSVRIFKDCRWVKTLILPFQSINIPKDPDLIVGYMFQGDINQLTITSERGVISKQCNATKVPVISNIGASLSNKSILQVLDDYLDEEYSDLSNEPLHDIKKETSDDEDLSDTGSGQGDLEYHELLATDNFDVKWSKWSNCTATCHEDGVQSRTLKCLDISPTAHENCLQAGLEGRIQTRWCQLQSDSCNSQPDLA